ncbi:sigma-70 family RNA polymerase sigma factor [Chitinophaga horti]|uniref:Sigma-70 family RNA polymerase sigma factor n=1 Tax=Chitinophaga horti TaxID=2920382 RepID=A0ABY6J394_9BACT|nr:sigma-70 family RNA polymerase sigma factor [Chitinophaga horti]UYQ92657.1 sigma-70 family RNA polymerase sigma factor [Chitinophaga horti]
MISPEHEIHDEVVLIQQFRAGSEEAFTSVYKHLYRRVYWFARKFMEETADAQDLTAEAFVQLWQQRDSFHSLDAISAFLYVTVRNKCFNLLKHRKMKASHQENLLRLLAEREPDGFFEEQVKIQLVARIYAEINKLPTRMREIFLLSYRDGLKPAEIAELLQIKAQTVTNQRVSAVKLLQIALGDSVLTVAFLLLLDRPDLF